MQDLTRLQTAYIVAMLAVAGTTGVVLAVAAPGPSNWAAVAGLAVMSALGERGRIQLRGMTVSISLLPAIFAAALFGPLAAMLVFASSVAGQSIPWAGRFAYLGSRSVTGAVSAAAASGASILFAGRAAPVIASAVAAAAAAEVIDTMFVTLTYWLRRVGPWMDAVRESVPVVVSSVPFYSFGVAILVFAYRYVSPWTLPLFFVPSLAAQRWFVMYQEQRRLASDLMDVNARLERANLSFATALVATLDARDRYTAGHSAAVAVYARDIAARMGLGSEDQNLAHLCGLVHDIGKIGLPAGLLEKPGALTLSERRDMQRHSEIGESILSNVETYSEIATVVRHHHERVDGNGYPDGISGDAIPRLARIIAVADAYNAMTSDRPYRDAMPSRVARLRLAQGVETQFDTAVVAAFEAVLAGAPESYLRAEGDEFYWTFSETLDPPRPTDESTDKAPSFIGAVAAG